MTPKNDNLDVTARLALGLQLALYLDLVAVLLTQRMMTGPHDGPEEFWQAAHDAVTP